MEMDLRYSISKKKRLIDSEPMSRGGVPMVWHPEEGAWTDKGLTIGEHMESVPITDEEAQWFIESGELSEDILRRLEYEYPEPWDD
jgi:hypothetical protein